MISNANVNAEPLNFTWMVEARVLRICKGLPATLVYTLLRHDNT